MFQDLIPLKAFYLEKKGLENLFLASVIATEGTTFRKVGAKMMIAGDTYQGVISGGCFENDVVARCLEFDPEQSASLVEYDLGSEEDLFFGTGVGCPGKVTLLLERIDQHHKEHFDALFANYDATQITTIWKKSVVSRNGSLTVRHKIKQGDDQETEWETPKSRSSFECDMIVEEAYRRPPCVHLFGTGDVMKSISALLEFTYTPFFAYVPEKILDIASKIFQNPLGVKPYESAEIFSNLEIDWNRDLVVLATHDFQFDLNFLRNVLRLETPPQYVGIMGSQKRREQILEQLHITNENPSLPFLHMPVGIPLGGRQPHEIALSIVSEISRESKKLNLSP